VARGLFDGSARPQLGCKSGSGPSLFCHIDSNGSPCRHHACRVVMAVTITTLRDNVERQLHSLNEQTKARLGVEGVEVVGIRHRLPKPDHPLETRRHIGDTPRTSTPRSTASPSSRDPLTKSQRIASMQRKVERSRKRREKAEKRAAELSRKLEIISTGYNVYGSLPRPENRVSTARRQELREIKRMYHELGLEHERRRVLTHAEADKKAFMATLRKK